MGTWELAATARTDFADMIEGLDQSQLDEASLCAEWTARGVLCHVTSIVEIGFFGLFGTMVRTGFNFDKASILMAKKQEARPVEDVIESLRTKATKSAVLPMFPEGMTVTDVAIHTQDVRWPLGLDGTLDSAVQLEALNFITGAKMAKTLVDRRDLDNVRLVATDVDWSFCAGPEITGTAEALLMGIANRPVLDDLSGDGLQSWNQCRC